MNSSQTVSPASGTYLPPENFFADWHAEIAFIMNVFGRNAGKQFRRVILLTLNWFDNDTFVILPHLASLLQAQALVESGDADNPEDVLMGLSEIGGRGLISEAVKAMRERLRDGTMAQQGVLLRSTVTRLPGAAHYQNLGRLALLT
ncbi:hypothetical protein [Paracoccus sp. (in: a-proteobacteria)]|uniref:hypothetical protein n=1 Tax=Paracoccus sp. TaxID=267 RepID=UPI00396CC231